MAKHSEDWIPFHGWSSNDWKEAATLGTYGWDSEDWLQAGLIAGGIALGGVAGAGIAAGAGVAAGAAVATGAGLGAAAGYLKGEEIKAADRAEELQERTIRKQEAEARQNEIIRKQSLLAANQTMTAREAMARNINAAIRNMYRPKTASNNPTPGLLGGDDQQLLG